MALIQITSNVSAQFKTPSRVKAAVYLRHLRPEIDLLQVDGMRSQVVQELAQQHPVPQGLRQVEHLRRGRSHPVVRGQHVAADQPHRTLPPVLHFVGER